jgi:hypothetical protein
VINSQSYTVTVGPSPTYTPEPLQLMASQGVGSIVAAVVYNLSPYVAVLSGVNNSSLPVYVGPASAQLVETNASTPLAITSWINTLLAAPAATPTVLVTWATQSADELSDIPTGNLGLTAVNIGGQVDIGSISGTVSVVGPVAASVTNSLLQVEGNVDVGTIESPVTIEAGTVDVQNVAGSFLLTGDLPGVSIGFTNPSGTVTTTTPVPIGMKALVIENAGGGTPCIVNVVGTTSGIRYGWNLPLGAYAPLVVTVDPGTDQYYSIREAGLSTEVQVSVGSIWALAQPPVQQVPLVQVATYHGQAYSGDTAETVISGNAVGTYGLFLIKRIIWSAVVANTSSGYEVGTINAVNTTMWSNSVQTWYFGVGPGPSSTVGYVSANGVFELDSSPYGGFPVATGIALGPVLTFAGNTSGSAFSEVDISVTYQQL